MAPADSGFKTNTPDLKAPIEYKILLMSPGETAPEILAELGKLPGSIIRVCSSFVELVLHLEHELFHIVMLIDDENSSQDCNAAIDHLAEAHKGTPVLVIGRAAMDQYTGKAPNRAN
ncbi:MAG TPA: hypothetical protein VFL79_01090 [Terriglobia bacterium]|nr:hypothetical protein [Terriglobia bacterium]